MAVEPVPVAYTKEFDAKRKLNINNCYILIGFCLFSVSPSFAPRSKEKSTGFIYRLKLSFPCIYFHSRRIASNGFFYIIVSTTSFNELSLNRFRFCSEIIKRFTLFMTDRCWNFRENILWAVILLNKNTEGLLFLSIFWIGFLLWTWRFFERTWSYT